MKKLLCLFLAILMLSLAACGKTTESESEPEIVDPNAYLDELFHGIYDLEERKGSYGEPMIGGGAFVPMRFSHERINDYITYNQSAKIAAPYYNCPAGVRMDFYTDAQEISFKYTVTEAFEDYSDYQGDSFDIYEDGVYQTSKSVKYGVNGYVTHKRTSTAAESRITIVFPVLHGVSCSSFKLGNARPLEKAENRILFLGASSSQGLFAKNPDDSYVHKVATALNADYMNLSVGGEIFRAAALDENINFDPTYIVVALGGNDYYSGAPASELRQNAYHYLKRLQEIYPNIPITVISPFGNVGIEHVKAISEVAADFGLHYVDGASLISSDLSVWNSDRVHPNAEGFTQIADALTPILKDKIG